MGMPEEKFTFHYASTLSVIHVLSDFPEIFIYIPLCFYFIHLRLTVAQPCLLYLHSTMLLLYPDPPGSPWASYFIYIPLCFYFIVLITVCISYLHYDLHSTMLLLYRFQRVCGCCRTHYLHSTMLLLYRCISGSSVSNIMIYIPLCFYFISPVILSRLTLYTFTFHYASTLSCVGISVDFVLVNIYIPLCFYFILLSAGYNVWWISFTFHYASTLSSLPGRESACFKLIYIPLCFYFIGYHPADLLFHLFDLHSTMLLLYQNQQRHQQRF